jgi:hypothetical protein
VLDRWSNINSNSKFKIIYSHEQACSCTPMLILQHTANVCVSNHTHSNNNRMNTACFGEFLYDNDVD